MIMKLKYQHQSMEYFVVDGIEKVIISQEIFCTPIFVYKEDRIEYKECNEKGKFQSLEMFTDYKYIVYSKKDYVKAIYNK